MLKLLLLLTIGMGGFALRDHARSLVNAELRVVPGRESLLKQLETATCLLHVLGRVLTVVGGLHLCFAALARVARARCEVVLGVENGLADPLVLLLVVLNCLVAVAGAWLRLEAEARAHLLELARLPVELLLLRVVVVLGARNLAVGLRRAGWVVAHEVVKRHFVLRRGLLELLLLVGI